jgi:hypothetical protein
MVTRERKEPKFTFPSGPGLTSTDAYLLARQIRQTTGWFAKQVPAWRQGADPPNRLYYVRCYGYRHAEETGIFYLSSFEEWDILKSHIVQQPAEEGE